MTVEELRILRWILGKTRKDGIRNERLWEHLRVAIIGDKLREAHLRLFVHVQHKLATALL